MRIAAAGKRGVAETDVLTSRRKTDRLSYFYVWYAIKSGWSGYVFYLKASVVLIREHEFNICIVI